VAARPPREYDLAGYATYGVGSRTLSSYPRFVPSRDFKPRLKGRLANGLRRERTRRRWTQEKAAELAGLNPRHYQKLEEGSVNVTLRTLERLCRAFGVDVSQLFAA
jgi:DNA-binding XRE family transcriptional regulator